MCTGIGGKHHLALSLNAAVTSAEQILRDRVEIVVRGVFDNWVRRKPLADAGYNTGDPRPDTTGPWPSSC
jgi:hypothetical protein